MCLTAVPSDLFQLGCIQFIKYVSHIYGRITVALGLFTVSSLLVGLDWFLMNLDGYLLLFRARVAEDDSEGEGKVVKRKRGGGERDGAIIYHHHM